MCGIAGFTNFSSRSFDVEARLRRMTLPLRPRGPDGEGYYVQGPVALGHRRLSIIDLEGGAQPMSAEAGRYQIILNGEIYNYLELRSDLEARGRSFVTHSDTEVLLHQLILDGPGALQKLDGMFAFAFWDAGREQLLLARDRIGIKPLFYALCDGDLVFASELKALLQHPAVPRSIDPLSLHKYLAYGYVPAPHTLYRQVRKLEPGEYLVFDRLGLRRDFYWDIPLTDHPVSPGTRDECADEILRRLDRSVRLHLRSDVPVGIFLSGGLDSSAVTALAARAGGAPLKTFSIRFEEDSYDESPYAAAVARQYGTEHHHEVLSRRQAAQLLPEALGILDEPLADASILPTYLLSRFTASRVKVALSGDGGDELFAGYPSFQAHRVVEHLSFLPAAWRDTLNRLARRIPVSHRYASLEHLARQFFKGAGLSPEVRFMLWMGCFGNTEKRQLLTPGIQAAIGLEDPFDDIYRYVRRSRLSDSFTRLLYLCMKMYLQDGVLVKVDRASMAHSLEVRVPLLDHSLVEFVSKIQPAYKLKGLTTKYIFKQAVRGLLPRRIIRRRKAGFMMPLASWLGQDLRSLVEDLCAPPRLRADGFFDPAFVRRLLDEHFGQVQDHRKQIYTLLCFQFWRQSAP